MVEVLRASAVQRPGLGRARGDRGRLESARVGAALLVLWAIAIAACGQVFAGPAWQWASGLAVAGAAAVPTAWRAWRPASRLGACAAGFAAAGAVAWWAVGTSGTWDLWREDPAGAIQQVSVQIAANAPPVPPSGLLHAVLVVLVALVAWLSAVLAFGAEVPLLAPVPPLVLSAVPAMVTAQRLGPQAALGIGAALCYLLWATSGASPDRTRGLLAAGATLGVAALCVAQLPPTVDRVWNASAVIGAPVAATTPDVMVNLGEDLTQPSQVEVFRYSSSPVRGEPRFTLAELVDFGAGTWKPLDRPDRSAPVTQTRTVDRPAGYVRGRQNPQRVTVEVSGLVSTWLPVPQGTERLAQEPGSSWSADRWTWVQDSQTVRSTSRATRRGDAYTAWALPAMDSMELRRYAAATGGKGSLTAGEDLSRYTALPEGVPEDIERAARSATRSATTRYDAAVALVRYFRSGAFTYDTQAPVAQGSGRTDQYAMITAFLQSRRGYCVHFAAAFATMARAVGIPTRIAVGYAGSEGSGGSFRSVTNRNLHAWPEVYFEGLGWVGFEPTPGGAGLDQTPVDDLASETSPTPGPSTSAGGAGGTTAAPSETPSESPGGAQERRGMDAAGGGSAGRSEAPEGPGGADVALATLAVAALAGAPAALRWGRRRIRIARVRRGRAPSRAAWREVVDSAVDLRLMPAPGTLRSPTPRALAEALGVAVPSADADLRALAAAVTREVYAAPSGDAPRSSDRAGLLRAMRTATAQMAKASARRRRALAALVPASLLRRRRHGRRSEEA